MKKGKKSMVIVKETSRSEDESGHDSDKDDRAGRDRVDESQSESFRIAGIFLKRFKIVNTSFCSRTVLPSSLCQNFKNNGCNNRREFGGNNYNSGNQGNDRNSYFNNRGDQNNSNNGKKPYDRKQFTRGREQEKGDKSGINEFSCPSPTASPIPTPVVTGQSLDFSWI
uniref:Uncharacterized protein n=1 Tax=Strigamia maritima TaxID=126957 RepID=T1ISI8_STRMM